MGEQDFIGLAIQILETLGLTAGMRAIVGVMVAVGMVKMVFGRGGN